MCQVLTTNTRIERRSCLSVGSVLISWGDPQLTGRGMCIFVTDSIPREPVALVRFGTALSLVYGMVGVVPLGWPHTN